jgi:hypothetical protein
MSTDNTSLRNLLLGSALGFGISITSVYSVLRLMRAQREAENGNCKNSNFVADPTLPSVIQ